MNKRDWINVKLDISEKPLLKFINFLKKIFQFTTAQKLKKKSIVSRSMTLLYLYFNYLSHSFAGVWNTLSFLSTFNWYKCNVWSQGCGFVFLILNSLYNFCSLSLMLLFSVVSVGSANSSYASYTAKIVWSHI